MSYHGTLSNEGVSFNYEVLSFDIEASTMVVQFTPTDADMIVSTFNCRFYRDMTDSYLDANGNLVEVTKTFTEHLENAIKNQAPIEIWKSQKIMVNNITV